jgi:hypothetical protein
MPDIQHRDAWPQMQQPGSLGPGHPGADLLTYAGHDVVLFFEDAVGAELAVRVQSELSKPGKAETNRVARVWHDSESTDGGTP